jgi:molybdenum cofactor cytidylyltransferase
MAGVLRWRRGLCYRCAKAMTHEPMTAEAGTGSASLRVAVVLLAAGLSTRMGDRNKLLIEIDGQPLVRRTALAYLATGADVHVVVGHEAARVCGALAGLPVTIIHNPRYADGQPASARAGLDSLQGDHDAVVMALADQPALTAADIGDLLRAFADSDRTRILIPHYGGRRGNPVVFPADIIARIVASGPHAACRGFIDDNPQLVKRHEAANDHVLIDIDAPEDLRACDSWK